jgi:hypothetical protein
VGWGKEGPENGVRNCSSLCVRKVQWLLYLGRGRVGTTVQNRSNCHRMQQVGAQLGRQAGQGGRKNLREALAKLPAVFTTPRSHSEALRDKRGVGEENKIRMATMCDFLLEAGIFCAARGCLCRRRLSRTGEQGHPTWHENVAPVTIM